MQVPKQDFHQLAGCFAPKVGQRMPSCRSVHITPLPPPQQPRASIGGAEQASEQPGHLFADRLRLIEIREARPALAQNFRSQLDLIGTQSWVNGLAVEVGGKFYLQSSLL